MRPKTDTPTDFYRFIKYLYYSVYDINGGLRPQNNIDKWNPRLQVKQSLIDPHFINTKPSCYNKNGGYTAINILLAESNFCEYKNDIDEDLEYKKILNYLFSDIQDSLSYVSIFAYHSKIGKSQIFTIFVKDLKYYLRFKIEDIDKFFSNLGLDISDWGTIDELLQPYEKYSLYNKFIDNIKEIPYEKIDDEVVQDIITKYNLEPVTIQDYITLVTIHQY